MERPWMRMTPVGRTLQSVVREAPRNFWGNRKDHKISSAEGLWRASWRRPQEAIAGGRGWPKERTRESCGHRRPAPGGSWSLELRNSGMLRGSSA